MEGIRWNPRELHVFDFSSSATKSRQEKIATLKLLPLSLVTDSRLDSSMILPASTMDDLIAEFLPDGLNDATFEIQFKIIVDRFVRTFFECSIWALYLDCKNILANLFPEDQIKSLLATAKNDSLALDKSLEMMSQFGSILFKTVAEHEQRQVRLVSTNPLLQSLITSFHFHAKLGSEVYKTIRQRGIAARDDLINDIRERIAKHVQSENKRLAEAEATAAGAARRREELVIQLAAKERNILVARIEELKKQLEDLCQLSPPESTLVKHKLEEELELANNDLRTILQHVSGLGGVAETN